MKFIEVCRTLGRRIQVVLHVMDDDMESEKPLGMNEVHDIMSGCWSDYHNYQVIVIKPISQFRLKVIVVKE